LTEINEGYAWKLKRIKCATTVVQLSAIKNMAFETHILKSINKFMEYLFLMDAGCIPNIGQLCFTPLPEFKKKCS